MALLADLLSSGFPVKEGLVEQLSRYRIRTVEDIFARSEVELVQILDVSQSDLQSLLEFLYKTSAPAPRTALLLLEERTRLGVMLSTGFSSLDAALNGGLLRGTVTELVGAAGTGKTQFALQCCASAGLSPPFGEGLHVLYLDVEHKFHAQRLHVIAKACGASIGQIRDLLSRVTVSRVSSTDEIVDRLLSVERGRSCYGLIVVDSIAAAARADFAGPDIVSRQKMLSKISSSLKRIGETFRSAILCTNQHTSSLVQGESIPALGVLWSHCVSTRLSLTSHGSLDTSVRPIRYVRVAKSPFCDVVEIAFSISDSGIQEG